VKRLFFVLLFTASYFGAYAQPFPTQQGNRWYYTAYGYCDMGPYPGCQKYDDLKYHIKYIETENPLYIPLPGKYFYPDLTEQDFSILTYENGRLSISDPYLSSFMIYDINAPSDSTWGNPYDSGEMNRLQFQFDGDTYPAQRWKRRRSLQTDQVWIRTVTTAEGLGIVYEETDIYNVGSGRINIKRYLINYTFNGVHKGQKLTSLLPLPVSPLMAGEEITVPFQTIYAASNHKLEYRRTDETEWNLICDTIKWRNDKYYWDVPENTGGEYLLRMTAAEDSLIGDTASVSIINFRVAYPNGGEVFSGGDSVFISWNSLFLTSELEMYFSDDGGTEWTLIHSGISTLNDSVLFVLPEINSSECLIKLSAAGLPYSDMSDTVFSITTPVSADEGSFTKKEFYLNQNYPNPFNPSTTIRYSIAEQGRVTLSIYDLLGREVFKLLDEEKRAGVYEITWNAAPFPSGVYFIKMEAGQFKGTRMLMLMK
jgi:hypothetical protein